jgi:AhpD family alkylhydroperoxidase
LKAARWSPARQTQTNSSNEKEMTMYDTENLKKLPKLGKNVPGSMKAFQNLNQAVFAEGALDPKTKELIAVAVSISAQCPYCIEVHNANAKKAGATEAELTEAIFVAVAIGAGAAVTHGTHVVED